jgi:hypothetical protein
MLINSAILPHVIIGFMVLSFYWVPLLSRKGGERHRKWGRAYFLSLVPILLSVIPIVLFTEKGVDPASVVQILYLTLCLGGIGYTGWNAIRRKAELERFRCLGFAYLGLAMLSGGLALLAIGLFNAAGLPVVLSSIGIVYGGAILRFYFIRTEPHRKWWLSWHLNAIALLFSATHGSVTAVLWKMTFGPGEGESVQIVAQSACLVLSLLLRIWAARRYGVPMRFSDRIPSTDRPRRLEQPS